MNEFLNQEHGVLASWIGIFLTILSFSWGAYFYLVSNKSLKINVSFGIPYPKGNLPFQFHICNPGKNQIRIEWVEFTVKFKNYYSVRSEIELHGVNKPMLTEGDILKFSINGQQIITQLKELICKNTEPFFNIFYSKYTSVFVISSTGKKYKAKINLDINNALLESFESLKKRS